MQTPHDSSPFQSFWMGGYECTDQLNISGNRVDLINATHHLSRLKTDYEDIKDFDITTVREGIRWSHVEKQPYQYDFSVVQTMLAEGKSNGIQQIWDICHFGYPDDLSPLHPHFTKRFVGICRAFVEFYRSEYPADVLIVTPINEVSFISWLGGEAAGTTPYCTGQGWTIKYELMRAYIAGIKAIKELDPSIRILTTEPIVNIVPPLFANKAEIEEAAKAHEEQFQALDILVGRICPELGGSPDLLDMMGVNFYYNNQWVVGFNEFLPWLNEEEDLRWRPLSALLTDAYNRYNKPIVLTETSHPKEDRPLWIDFVTNECFKAIQQGIPFWGICLYPIIDRPDWDNLTYWHQSGLWDEVQHVSGTTVRLLNEPYANALRKSQRLIYQIDNPSNRRSH
ncbi:amine oxidase [Mucilaginibacter limnophilus]|uniref:Amine oxidase n=1 Tax=Mucilaginibacter limnophilus TaxID=1932778 RepID=A0A3S2VQC9_9SPHI|nr:amine oxidase [Mucilaginibacter limnophilus]RVU02967.1 amine oxidase [Mucilaginibacter limnophilus]